MRILVCVKQAPDPEADFEPLPDAAGLLVSGGRFVMNAYDAHAVEMALGIKEAAPGTEVAAMTLGPERSKAGVHRALAMGADRGILIDTEGLTLDSYTAAVILAKVLPNEKFDIVFTSYGTIGWLPDLDKWAKIVSRFLKPNGQFVFVEFHPVVWMFDDDFEKIQYRYFNSGAIVETESGTYADKKADITQSYVMWNHSMSEVLNSLIKNGLEITSLDEFDYSPYNCFNKTVEPESGKYRIEHLNNKVPMVYSIKAIRKIK